MWLQTISVSLLFFDLPCEHCLVLKKKLISDCRCLSLFVSRARMFVLSRCLPKFVVSSLGLYRLINSDSNSGHKVYLWRLLLEKGRGVVRLTHREVQGQDGMLDHNHNNNNNQR